MSRPHSFAKLLEVMAALRAPNGCPWDREQTHESLLPYLREEGAELADAVLNLDDLNLQEELGDVLLQVIFHAQIAKERGAFTMDEVVDGIAHKLISRHPHVFGAESIADAKGVETRWEEIKKQEKAEQGKPKESLLDGIPKSMSAADRADKIGKRVKKVGFEWATPLDVLTKVEEEIAELRAEIEVGDLSKTEEEMGDVLFTLAQLCRKLDLSTEMTLHKANQKFERRFKKMEALEQDLALLNAEELELLWQRVKKTEKLEEK